MKLSSFKFVAVAALGAWLASSSASSAQDTNVTRRTERRGPMIQQRVERMTTELKLNPDQQAKVKALLEKQAKDRREIFSDTNLPRDERREKMRTINQEEAKELKTILTTEQLEKWKKLREEMRSRRPGGPGQPGEPAPAPAPAPQPKSQ
jgi:Spy/CpxP family protein refolding chaperone